MEKAILERIAESGDKRVLVYYDHDAIYPGNRVEFAAKHLWEHLEHRGWSVSRHCDHDELVFDYRDCDLSYLLQMLCAKTVEQKHIIRYIWSGKVEGVRLIFNPLEKMWELQTQITYGSAIGEWVTEYDMTRDSLKCDDWREELLESLDDKHVLDLLQKYAGDIVIKQWDSHGYSQGDAMRGFSYMTKESFEERCVFNPERYKDWKEQALDVMQGEIDVIKKWAWGDVYGFKLEQKVAFTKVYDDESREDEKCEEWEKIDSCWGIYQEPEKLAEEVLNGEWS